MTTLPAQAATINAEFLIRETLLMGFAEFASSKAQQHEVLDRIDMLRQGSQSSWREDCAAALRDTFDPTSPNALQNVCIGHPTQEAVLPWIGIVQMAEAEDASGSMAGDILTRVYSTTGDLETNPEGFRVIRHEVLSTDYTSTIQVAVWTTVPELSIVLQAAAQYVMELHKDTLGRAGVYTITMSCSSFTPDPMLEPRVAYVPIITVVLSFPRRRTRTTDPVPNRITQRYVYGSS